MDTQTTTQTTPAHTGLPRRAFRLIGNLLTVLVVVFFVSAVLEEPEPSFEELEALGGVALCHDIDFDNVEYERINSLVVELNEAAGNLSAGTLCSFEG